MKQGGAGLRPLVLRSTVKDARKPLWKIPAQAELGRGAPASVRACVGACARACERGSSHRGAFGIPY